MRTVISRERAGCSLPGISRRQCVAEGRVPTNERIAVPDRKLSPCAHQTEAEIENYYRNQPEGSPAIVRRTHGGILTYQIATFGLRRTRTGRINVEGVVSIRSATRSLRARMTTNRSMEIRLVEVGRLA